MAREYGFMPYSDCRASNPENRMVGARDGEFVIFKESLNVRFRWTMHHFFIRFLLSILCVWGSWCPILGGCSFIFP